jgi:hypothetical protein
MSLITLFSAPKPFTDPRIAMIQNNAIASWTRLEDAEVLLMGEEDGLQEAAERHGVAHIRGVQRNDSGTPLISSMVQLARERSRSQVLCIINTDMIAMADFVEAGKRVMGLRSRFVLVSRRWDLDVQAPIQFVDGWDDRLRWAVREQGVLHRPAGSDFFLFPRMLYTELPPFAIGRAGWDNWMIYEARKEHWPVVDGTPWIMLVHQNHDYSHLPGGEPHYSVPESDENIRLAGGEAAIRYTIVDATHCLRGDKLERPPLTYLRFMRGVELFLRTIFFFLPPKTVEQVARPKRWKKRVLRLIGIR